MTQRERLPIGLVGLGSWATRVYVPLLLERQDVAVRAVAARSDATRRRARETFGPDVQLYPDYSDLLERSGVEVVMICLPPPLGTKAATAAVAAGRHVWVEPPLEEGHGSDRLLEIAARSERVFHLDLELRYLPVVGALRGLVSTGQLGTPRQVHVALEMPSENPHVSSYVFALGPWYVDLVDTLIQLDAKGVELAGADSVRGSPIGKGKATVHYADGAKGEWTFDFGKVPELSLRVKLVGTEGEAEANLVDGTYRHRRTDGSWQSGVADCSRPVHGFVGMRECLGEFLSAVRSEGEIASGARSYRRLQDILSALHRTERRMISEGLGALESPL